MKLDELKDLVGTWQARLGLADHRITVQLEDDPRAGDCPCVAKICRSTYFNRATLVVDRGLVEKGELSDSIENDLIASGTITVDQFIEETVVHELLHVAVNEILETSDLIREHIANPALSVWDAAWKRVEEAFVERTAIALANTYNNGE